MKRSSIVTTAALCLFAASTHAAIIADFSGGTGNASSDQYLGTAGNGWVDAWQETERTDAGNTASFELSNANPINGGGDYLEVYGYKDSDSGGTRSNAGREWSAFSGVSPTNGHIVTFDFRVDTWETDNKYGDFVQFMALDDFGSSSNFNNSAWAFRLVGGDDQFQVRDGGGNTGMSLAFATGVVYHAEVTVDPATESYSLTLTNTSTAESETVDATFSSSIAPDFFHTGISLQAETVDNTPVPSTISYAFDNLNITAVPEPSTYALIFGTIGLALAIIRRRRR